MENSLDLQDAITRASTQLQGLGLILGDTNGNFGDTEIAALSFTLIAIADRLDADLAKVQDRKPAAA